MPYNVYVMAAGRSLQNKNLQTGRSLLPPSSKPPIVTIKAAPTSPSMSNIIRVMKVSYFHIASKPVGSQPPAQCNCYQPRTAPGAERKAEETCSQWLAPPALKKSQQKLNETASAWAE